jgi:integrase/recombinase XerD
MDSDDPFADMAGIRLAEASRHNYLFVWRRFLGFLALHEITAMELDPTERLTPERVRAFVDHLRATNTPRSVAIQIHMLYSAARLMMPEWDWTWLKTVKKRLAAMAPVHTATGPVITSIHLLKLGLQLMLEGEPSQDCIIRTKEAITYRDGLMIALLAFIPIRRKNLAALEIDRHLVRDSHGWFVIIPGQETKAGRPIEFRVPELLEAHLAIYLRVVRPRLLRHPNCAALWMSAKGGALCYGAINNSITRHSVTRLGFRITLHDARDAAATTWAIAAPDQIAVARDLLAHADLRTTVKHYNRARGTDASRAYGQVIAEMRRKNRHQR